MSKASEWAAVRRKYERSPSFAMTSDLFLSIARPTRTRGVRLRVHSRYTRLVDDKASVRHAVKAARWILDTFGEVQP